MKVSFVLLLIVAVASASFENGNSNEKARVLQKKVKFLLEFAEKIRGDLEKASVKAEQGGDKIELGIYNDEKIKEIEQTLDSYASNKNADECKNLYTSKQNDLKQKLQNVLEDEVVKQAQSISQGIEFVQKEISTVSANLEEEINACNSESNACKLTESYAAHAEKIHRNEDVLRNFERHSLLIVDFIFTTRIEVQLQNQIDTNVYFPVNDCLNKL